MCVLDTANAVTTARSFDVLGIHENAARCETIPRQTPRHQKLVQQVVGKECCDEGCFVRERVIRYNDIEWGKSHSIYGEAIKPLAGGRPGRIVKGKHICPWNGQIHTAGVVPKSPSSALAIMKLGDIKETEIGRYKNLTKKCQADGACRLILPMWVSSKLNARHMGCETPLLLFRQGAW